MAQESALVFLVLNGIMSTVQGREFCEAGPTPQDDYYCDVGHCCNGECCTYYYELWWFWLVWFMIVFVIGFCVWQRKKFHPWREHEAYRRSHCGLCGPPDLYPDILPIPPVKLPSYAEIGETASFNTPPPPYTCECYMPTMSSSVLSFDHPPPEVGAPPRYMPYTHIIAPLLPRMNSTTSSMGTQFPEDGSSSSEPSPGEGPVVHAPPQEEALVQSSPTQQSPPVQQPPTPPPMPQHPPTPGSPCLSCSSPSTPLTASRSCSCSPVQGTSGVQQSSPTPQTVNTRGAPGLAFPVGLGTNLVFRPAWYGGSFGKGDAHQAHRAQVPFIRGSNYNPCPRCVSQSSTSLGQAPSTMRDASTSTLNSVAPPPAPQNQEPDRYERRNSYSLPRNFVCSTKRPT